MVYKLADVEEKNDALLIVSKFPFDSSRQGTNVNIFPIEGKVGVDLLKIGLYTD